MGGVSEYPEEKVAFVERIHEYGSVFTYVFRSAQPFSYIPGQYVHMRLSGMPPEAKAVREFSFASAPHEPDIRFGIDSRSQSLYQKALQALVPGDTVGLFKIKNHLTWPPEVPHAVSEALAPASLGRYENEFSQRSSLAAVMIAGGVGVTPFRSMLCDRKHMNIPVFVTLLHIGRGDFLYTEELSGLADAYRTADHGSFESSINDIAEKNPDAHFYIAGSVRFVEAALSLLAKRNIKRVEADPFKGLID